MPMDKEKFESFMNELNNPELEHARKTEILSELRADYTNVHTDFEELTSSNSKLKATNEDLVIANSKLFRERGIDMNDPAKQQQEQQKTFSESITLEQIERSVN